MRVWGSFGTRAYALRRVRVLPHPHSNRMEDEMAATDVSKGTLTAEMVRAAAKKLWATEPLPMIVSREAYEYYKSLTEKESK